MAEKDFFRIAKLVGNTPLIEILQTSNGSRVLAKLEYYNPSGSVKDRAVKEMLEAGLKSNELTNRTIIEATSGNTGISVAMFGSALSLPVKLIMPETASVERKKIVACYGAVAVLTSGLEGTDGAQREAAAIVAADPKQYFQPDQYNNENNWYAHFTGTGTEIWEQSVGKVTHFVAGMGTSGTFVGASRYLINHKVHCISIQPNNPMHGIEGWKHLATAIVPGIYDETLAESVLHIETDVAYKFAVAASRYLGHALSPSSAANLWGALEVAKNEPGSTVVTVFPDNSFKYLNDDYWENDDYTIRNPFDKN